MEGDSLKPDEVTFLNLLKGCQTEEHLEFCQLIHNCCIEYGHETDLYIGSCLVDVYCTCGRLIEAWRVFEVMPERNVVSWNAIVTGCAERGDGEDVLELYEQMQVEGLHAEDITYVSIFNAWAKTTNFKQGRIIHSLILFSGREQNLFVDNALVDMYGKCGVLCEAFKVFRNMPMKDIVWRNALISCYAQHGTVEEAVKLFEQMEGDSLKPDEVTFLNLLKGCQTEEHLEFCQLIHNCCIEYGHETDLYIGSCLVDVYCTCGRLIEAWRVFEVMPERNVVSWNAIVTRCAERGDGEDVLELYEQMQVEGLHAEDITYVSVFNAWAETTNFKQGRIIHSLILFSGREQNLFVDNALVDMYGKCGVLCEAFKVFRNMPMKDIVWRNALISCYAQHGAASKD
ncbi:hypothetical protein KP509_15G052100 [Ceratopteris richardii]|uniref:Pentatricopeptide repeat-containing protein n=1 Tax=Ceratopteris richardii TaxID=49495 RepID=A0A8T2T3A3_CERRI|nr:hypothetical protein KP509_15G052100 [Ceratopteris richardii]